MLSPGIGQVTHALLTRPPLTFESLGFIKSPFDLHVLGTPPAFILSQDQTLILKSLPASFHWLFIPLLSKLPELTVFWVVIPFRSTLQPSFHLSLVLDTIIRISLNKSRVALSSCSLGIFRVALLFICQGTVCCCVPQQLCYLITGFLLCQQLFLTFLSCLLLSAILSCRSNFDILSQLFCFVNNFLNLFRHFRYCSARAIRKATKSR